MKIITSKKKQNKRTELDFLLHYAKIISTIVLFFFTSIIANAQCAPSGSNPDTDGDGFANSCDTDSDNDGITDIVEGRFTCTNSVTTSMNTVPYPLNTLFNAAQNTTPVTIDNLSYGTLNFTASLVGTATWGAASGTSGNVNRVGGVQIKNNFSAVGDYIYLQPINTRTTNTGAVANPSNYALYTLLLPYKTDNFQFISAGLNSDDAYEIYAFNGATPIPLNPSNLSNFSPALGTAGTWTVSDLGNGLKVTNALAAGGADVDQNLFTTTITGAVTRIEIRSYKNLTGTNSNTVTTGITSLIYCSDYSIVDSDADGISNYLDLDSDNDGCTDANEYYNSAIADGGDGGTYGTGTPLVGSEGQVTTASYTGNYNNVIVATQLNITSQPSNSIVNAGANTSFTVGATGINTSTFSAGTANYNIPPATNANAGLVYQWQISTNSGSTWTNISNGGQYSGATTASLSVNNTTAAQNGNQFRAVVSHSGKICPIISNAAQITILQANVGITKTVNNLTPNIGSNVIFTLTADNAGPNNAAGVEVTDVLPSGYTFVSATPSVGTFNSGTGLWTVGTLNNGANATLTVTATVNATGNYANTATITSTTSDPTPGNNTDTETPTPGAQTNLSVVKTVNNTTPNVGDNVTFTITASNAGPSAATGVSVNDVLPSGYTFVSATPSTGTWTAPNWSVGGLANGASATLSIVATVNATGSYSNTAVITGLENDPTPGNNTDTETPTPVAQTNLSVVKTVNNTTPNVGDNVTFTITASNAGPSAATGVSVNDVLPSGYTFVSATPSTGTWTAPNWSVGGLASGASATLSIVATVNATGSYGNTAVITGLENDPTPGNNTDTETPTPVAQTNLSVVKTVNNTTPNVGDNVTFTITASNAGPSAATGVSVNDVLPSGYTFVSATPSTGTWTAPNWSVGGLANGASATLSIVATVKATGLYSNTAVITGLENDPTPGNNTDTETPTPVAQSNLSVVKTVDNATPNVGDNVTFTITASNAGPSAATGVSVNDVLPSGYTFVSATPSVGTFNSGTGLWTVGTLNNGANATLTVTVTVNATGNYANTATITSTTSDPTPGNNTDTETPTPVAQSNLSVVKTVDNATPNVGDNVTFTITASNAGPSAATGVSVNDVLPSGYTFVSATPSTGTWTAPNWSVGGLANGASATLSIVATVKATGSYGNTAVITGLENDPTPGNNTDTETPTPGAQTNLSVVKTVNNTTPNVGDNVTFTITASNAGPSAATGVSVNDVLPSGYTFVSATPSTGTWTAPNWSVGGLANGASATLSIVATVNATGSYSNTAVITGLENDPTPGNNTDTETPTPVAQTNLSVVKTVNNTTPNVGDNVTFTITASNAGPSAATGVSVNDVLPSGYTFVSATPSTGTWTAPNWSVGGLANGASATLSIVATVNATGSYGNTAVITGLENDPTPGNNTDTETPTPVAQTNLSVVKTVNNTTPNVGDNVTFTITASNAGPSAATGVSVNDVLPSGYTFVSATPSTGTWTAPNWSVGGLANGASATLSIVATVKATGSYGNTAVITGLENDPTPGNNTDTETPTPVAQTNLSVVKTVNNTTPNVGDNVTFTITASNAGPSAATGVSVNDVLPSGYTFVSATPSTGTWTAPNWSVGGLANGASATLSIVATVNATGSYGNTAVITGLENDPTPGNNTDTETPTPVAQTNLSVVKTVDNATPNVGDNVTFTITASNAGPSAATGVSVNDVLPSGYTFVSATPSTGTWTAPNWSVGGLANGASATLSIVATVKATGSYGNTAVITGLENDPTTGNNTDTETPTPVAQTNLSVVKTVNNTTPNVGDNVTFTITASNAGPSAATGVSVNDVLPSGYTFVSATPSTGTWTAPNWSVGGLANGASATLSIVATVKATGSYGNTAVITGLENDPTPGNNTDTETPTPVAQTNLSVVKTVNNTTPNVGDNVTFTITASNAGPSAATGVSVNDVLPSGYTFVSATPSTGTWTAPNWSVGGLANGASATLSIVATVKATGSYGNTAVITGLENDPTPGNNTDTETPTPVAQSNLSVVKTVDNATPNVGDNVTFTITASNAGPSAATGVSVNDVLPSGYTFVSATPSTGTWTAPNWSVGGLANGASATLSIVATVNSTGSYSNTAVITGLENDPTLGNNTDTEIPNVNHAPVAVNDTYTVVEDNTVTLNPLALDTDLDGDTLTVTSINGTVLTGGVQTITVSNGTVNISALGVITFTPDANYSSATAISIPYMISDGTVTATANELITVTAANDAPVAVNDTYTVAEDNTVTLNPLALDTDLDGDSLTVTSINGTVLTGGVQTITVSNGTVNISALGVITFTPDANYNSATAISIPYVISDGTVTATASELITVTAANDAPVAVNDIYTVAEDNTVTLNPLALDTDLDGDTLTVTSINGTVLTGGVQTIPVSNGTVNISALGVITFTPDANYNSATAISIPYVISDGTVKATASELITVTAANDASVAVNDTYTVVEDNTITLSPLALDTDLDGDTLTVTSINGTALTGGVQTISVSNGTVNISALGVITFTPDANYNSATAISIPYVISDGTVTATANELITVTAANDAPVAVNDIYTVAEDNTITLNPLALDTDLDGDTLTVTSINGTVLTGGVQTIPVSNGTVNISALGVITFTPDANYNSATAISIPYVISDGTVTATAIELITVTAANDAPVAINDTYTVAEDNTITLNPLALDTDLDGDTLTVTSINGTVLTGGVQTITVSNGTVNISALGVITFTPDANYNSATAISIPYVISDGTVTATANELITVTAANDAPIANYDTNTGISSIAEATLINALSATDVDGTIASYKVISLPTNGILALAGIPITVNQILTPAEAAMLTYDPSGTYTGLDTFMFTATDNLGAVSGSATITIPIENNAPVAKDNTNVAIPSGAGATAINALTATDSDGVVVNYIVVTLPSNGILALSGTPILVNQVLTPAEAAMLTYDPNGVFSGNDTFTFTVTDNNGAVDSTPAVITISVDKRKIDAVNDEIGSVVGINESVDVINVLDNDTLDNNPIVLSDIKLEVLIPDPKGLLTLKSDGTAQIAPNTPAGTYTLTYQICEAANGSNCTTATATVTVIAPEMTVTAESYCSDNTAYVTYKVTADNFTPKGLVTINWIDSANHIVATQSNMPLNGTVLWPGTVLDSNNKPIDWPGWILLNGKWIEGNDGFELTRPAVTMQFTLNPNKSVLVNYPSAQVGCNARPQFGIVAENDDAVADGIKGSLEVINVLDNDKLNGVPVNPADVILKGQNFPAGITLNYNGTINVAAGTKGGDYILTYQICEKANANNCTTATVHIFVETPAVSLIMKASLNDNNGNGFPEAGETITYTFTVKNTGNTALENVLIKDLLPGVVITGGPINLGVGESDTFTFTGTYTLTQADINAGVVSNQATVSGVTQSGITASDNSDSENEGSDKPTVINLNGCDLEVHNAVSLNGDEKNERFYIRGMECYPDNTVQIFNRWGVLVFERDHYNNNDVAFKGFSEGRTTVKQSEGLPEGTYYYIIRYKDNQSKPQQQAGYLYLTR